MSDQEPGLGRLEPRSPYWALSMLPEGPNSIAAMARRRGREHAVTPAVRSPGTISRRTLLGAMAIGGTVALAGCIGDDDDDDVTPTPEETPPDDETPTPDETPPADDPTPTPDDDPDELVLDGDITSFVSELTVHEETADGDVTLDASIVHRWDFANERTHHTFDLRSEDEHFESYHIEGTIYTLFDDMCHQVEDVPFEPETGFAIEDPREFEDGHLFSHVGSDTFRGQTVEAWELRPEGLDPGHEGHVIAYVDPDTNWLVGFEGEMTFDHPEHGQVTQTFEQHLHSYNEDLGIEVPEACLEG